MNQSSMNLSRLATITTLMVLLTLLPGAQTSAHARNATSGWLAQDGVIRQDAGPTAVPVELNEFTVTPDRTSVPAGQVTFTATNSGAVNHELVILKSDADPAKLPFREGVSKVDEDAVGQVIGEIEDDELPAGATESFTGTLEPGNYILLCNVEGHYAAGMYVAFTVTDKEAPAAPPSGSGLASDNGGNPFSPFSPFVLSAFGVAALLAAGGTSLALALASRLRRRSRQDG